MNDSENKCMPLSVTLISNRDVEKIDTLSLLGFHLYARMLAQENNALLDFEVFKGRMHVKFGLPSEMFERYLNELHELDLT